MFCVTMFYRTPFRPRAVTVSVSRVWTPISRTDNLDFVPTRRNSVRCCRQTRYQGVLSIAFLLNLFMVIYFFFTNGCLCIFFYIAHCRMLFECTLSSFLFPPTRVSKKLYQCKTLCLENVIYLIDHLGSYLVYIWFIYFL